MALVAHPASCEGHGVDVRFTVRLAQCEPVDDAAGDLRMLLRHAEEALSQAKQQRLCGPEPDVIDGFEALVR